MEKLESQNTHPLRYSFSRHDHPCWPTGMIFLCLVYSAPDRHLARNSVTFTNRPSFFDAPSYPKGTQDCLFSPISKFPFCHNSDSNWPTYALYQNPIPDLGRI